VDVEFVKACFPATTASLRRQVESHIRTLEEDLVETKKLAAAGKELPPEDVEWLRGEASGTCPMLRQFAELFERHEWRAAAGLEVRAGADQSKRALGEYAG